MKRYASLGGGGSLDQAYGAIASQPGVVVTPGQSGWAQAIYVRGGDFNQVGYEFDGVPVLRPYDNYPTTTESTLGQQELQIYSGGAPTDSQTEGLAGYINQVTQTGSYPGFATLDLVTGSPALYDSAKLEVGGATQNGSFSYFLALGSSAQGLRWFDNSNGAGIQSTWGAPFARLSCPGGSAAKNFSSCYATGIGPGGYALGPPVDAFAVAQVWDHESILNLHFGIPHKSDQGKDDVQLLYDNSYLHDTFYGSASDWTLPDDKLFQQLNGDQAFHYLSGRFIGYQYLGAVGQLLNFSSPQQLASMVNDVFYAYNPDSIRPNLVLPPIPTG
ncbi:MAG TPA: TonB-dependent receptor, partial [Chloroflexota bacterium]|nr:TonB-dependent receptor [Chloroflexota bacterium]